jgi:hypothetical protein
MDKHEDNLNTYTIKPNIAQQQHRFGGLKCFYETFVLKQILGIFMDFSLNNYKLTNRFPLEG